MSPPVCLRAVRQGGSLLSWNQRLRSTCPHPPQGPDCDPALNEPVSPSTAARLLSLMSLLWEWPFVVGSGHSARARGSQKAPFPRCFPSPAAAGVGVGGGNGRLLPCPSPFSVLPVFSGVCTRHVPTGQELNSEFLPLPVPCLLAGEGSLSESLAPPRGPPPPLSPNYFFFPCKKAPVS